jgi:hypothetical protein
MADAQHAKDGQYELTSLRLYRSSGVDVRCPVHLDYERVHEVHAFCSCTNFVHGGKVIGIRQQVAHSQTKIEV